LKAVFAIVGVRDWDMAVLGVADCMWLGAVSCCMQFEAPLAAVAAVAVSVVTWLHVEEAVVADLEITVFILDKVDFACQRWIGPCARSLCSFEQGNRER
jgi:hypothetical protein